MTFNLEGWHMGEISQSRGSASSEAEACLRDRTVPKRKTLQRGLLDQRAVLSAIAAETVTQFTIRD